MPTEHPTTASDTQFTHGGETVSGYLARPTDVTSAPALVLIHEWWGLNDHIKDIAMRYARAGFIAAAVDLYHGTVTKDAGEAARLMGALPPERALADLGAAINHLRGEPDVTGVGVTGFCMGGVYTLLAASTHKVDAAVAFYGVPDDLSVLQSLSCPLLFIAGERDQWITVEKVRRMEAALKEYGKDAEVRIYDGADHAFFNDTRPDVYSPADAADAWQRAVDFFSRHLQRGQTAAA
jgi:carboxymethylenebutenolidase